MLATWLLTTVTDKKRLAIAVTLLLLATLASGTVAADCPIVFIQC